jgi:4-hydroxybenzoate polyprenyltransferase
MFECSKNHGSKPQDRHFLSLPETTLSKALQVCILMRWPNLLIIFFGFLLIYLAMDNIQHPAHSFSIPNLSLIVSAASLSLAAAWGYVINDLRDVQADRINRRKRPLVTNELSLAQGQKTATRLLYLTLGIALAAGLLLNNILFSLLILVVLVTEYLYTFQTRHLPLIGSLLTALLVSSTVALPAWLYHSQYGNLPFWESPYAWPVWFFGVFAFLTTLTREQAKDLEDIAGDKYCAYASLPLLIGVARARKVLRTMLLLNFLLILGLIPLLLLHQYTALAMYAATVLCLPLLWLLIRFPEASRRKYPLSVSATLKGIMVLGLIAALWL